MSKYRWYVEFSNSFKCSNIYLNCLAAETLNLVFYIELVLANLTKTLAAVVTRLSLSSVWPQSLISLGNEWWLQTLLIKEIHREHKIPVLWGLHWLPDNWEGLCVKYLCCNICHNQRGQCWFSTITSHKGWETELCMCHRTSQCTPFLLWNSLGSISGHVDGWVSSYSSGKDENNMKKWWLSNFRFYKGFLEEKELRCWNFLSILWFLLSGRYSVFFWTQRKLK